MLLFTPLGCRTKIYIHEMVSWLPMDAVAKAIVDTAFTNERLPPALNLVHPRPVEWNLVITSVRDAVKQEITENLELVSFQEWFSRLELHSKGAEESDMSRIVSGRF